MTVDINKVPEFYRPYFKGIGEEEGIIELLERSGSECSELIGSLPEEKGSFRYAEGKWSIKDLVQHVIDAERVFAYRVMRFARNDKTDLPGFEQDDYVEIASADRRTLQDLLSEFETLRRSTLHLFSGLTGEDLKRTGTANGFEMSVEMVGYIISGHLLHHLRIIRERYL